MSPAQVSTLGEELIRLGSLLRMHPADSEAHVKQSGFILPLLAAAAFHEKPGTLRSAVITEMQRDIQHGAHRDESRMNDRQTDTITVTITSFS